MDHTDEQVSAGLSGHAEVVKVIFDAEVIAYKDLLEVFFSSHDPPRPSGRQRRQYRSIVLCSTEEQFKSASIAVKAGHGASAGEAATEVLMLAEGTSEFYTAEERHQDYVERRGNSSSYSSLVILPKLKKLCAGESPVTRFLSDEPV